MAKIDHLDDRALWAAVIDAEASYHCAVIALDEARHYPLTPEEFTELCERLQSAASKHQELINERNRRTVMTDGNISARAAYQAFKNIGKAK